MTYRVIQPPFTLRFHKMTKEELVDYFHWFLSILPNRIHELESVVKSASNFRDWRADGSVGSFQRLSKWFPSQVETRVRINDENADLQTEQYFQIPISDRELTNRTFSLCVDIAMYMASVFLTQFPLLRWEQHFGSKKNVDYGQPVLVGFDVPMNPVRILVTFAYGIATSQSSPERLNNIFAYWVDKVGKLEIRNDKP